MLFNMEDDKYDSADILSQALGNLEQNVKLDDFEADLTYFFNFRSLVIFFLTSRSLRS